MPQTFKTRKGTSYLKEPGVVTLARPDFDLDTDGIYEFLHGFDQELGFLRGDRDDAEADVIDDDKSYTKPVALGLNAERLVKFAGQLCYLSLGPKRSMNADMKKYLDHIKKSGHGSVCEHANYSFLLYGISRSMTHELVRHRAGFAYSQTSQRYVDGKVLRFVERPEYQEDPILHELFENRIDRFATEYANMAGELMQRQDSKVLESVSKTDRRKMVNQCARSILPNETEAPIVVTANVRAWRHFLEMRASQAAEIEIRRLAMAVYRELVREAPILFDDYEVVTLPDGTNALRTEFRKV
jgi:thymidylate synthase (FAD)